MAGLEAFLKQALEPAARERRGQRFMNVLYRVKPALYDLLTNTATDPFYKDENLWAAIQFVIQQWEHY